MQSLKQCKTELIQLINDLPEEKIIELFAFAKYFVSQYSKKSLSPVDYNSLMLQQKALGKIWDNPEEDIYEL